ncbi:MAG: hypothetical protein RLZZ347_800 [Candidatus Parcubacteria bacterium]|jgi:hypothetical protein
MHETILTIDHKGFNLRQSGYKHSVETPPENDRRLGTVTYRAKVLRFEEPIRIDNPFPWDPADIDIFELADPVHLIAFRDTPLAKQFPWVFAIGKPRQHSVGLMVGCLGGREPLGNDTYLPSWVAGIPDPRCKFESKGFPPGTGFLVVARQS